MTYTIPLIDYEKMAKAKSFYEKKGYKEIPVPWIVPFSAYSATRPSTAREFYTLDGYLNASGEQSFIALMEEGLRGRFLCITPCFRDEEVLDELHHKYFFKLELIDTDAQGMVLKKMIEDAKEFFELFLRVDVVKTDMDETSHDICSKSGIELGSYGIRHTKKFSWVYGTGLALPRLDTVLQTKKHI